MEDFKINGKDCGSTGVQIYLLGQKISKLFFHIEQKAEGIQIMREKNNKNDIPVKRKLVQLYQILRAKLKYLKLKTKDLELYEKSMNYLKSLNIRIVV